MDYVTPKSFRSQPVKIKVGSKDKEITIKDLSYGRHQEFVALITGIQLKRKSMMSFDQVSGTILNEKIKSGISPIDAAKELALHVEKILLDAPSNERIQLLLLLTDNQLTEDEILNDLESDEFFGLLEWLIEKNLRAEKNFEASLNSMMNPKSSDTQK